jgi:hypothetical protein
VGEDMLGYGMIDKYNDFKLRKISDEDCIRWFAGVKMNTYSKYISNEDRELFIRDMKEHWRDFFFDGKFTEKSVDWINACHDGFVYPRLEGWTHLKIDSKQPLDIKHSKDFNVHFEIFHKDEFTTPGHILELLKKEYIIPSGTIKNNGRDKAVHVDIK